MRGAGAGGGRFDGDSTIGAGAAGGGGAGGGVRAAPPLWASSAATCWRRRAISTSATAALRWSSSTRDWSAAKSALASLAETPLVAQPPTNSAIVAHSV